MGKSWEDHRRKCGIFPPSLIPEGVRKLWVDRVSCKTTMINTWEYVQAILGNTWPLAPRKGGRVSGCFLDTFHVSHNIRSVDKALDQNLVPTFPHSNSMQSWMFHPPIKKWGSGLQVHQITVWVFLKIGYPKTNGVSSVGFDTYSSLKSHTGSWEHIFDVSHLKFYIPMDDSHVKISLKSECSHTSKKDKNDQSKSM
jgi:hypothetical protein